MVSRSTLRSLLCLLHLHLLSGLVQLVQILARVVPLYTLANMMAMGFVLDRPLVASFGWRRREMRLRRRLPLHGRRPLRPRISFVGRSHAYGMLWPLRCAAAAGKGRVSRSVWLFVTARCDAHARRGGAADVESRRLAACLADGHGPQLHAGGAMGWWWYRVCHVGANDKRWM